MTDQLIRYGYWMTLSDVTRVNEVFGNQTIIEAIKWTDFEKYLGFSGGNVSITVTGYLRGPNRRNDKGLWEGVRNFQAMIAHIPGPSSSIGLGQAILWVIATTMFPFWSEMCFQSSMVIKTMEFEDAPDHKDMYAYSITFEKLSFGIVQFIIDMLINCAGIACIPNLASPGTRLDVLNMAAENLSGYQENPPGEDISTDALPESIEESFDVGQETIRDTSTSNTTIEFHNLPEIYDVLSDIDKTLEWRNLPFLSSFPQTFSFDLGDHRYEMYWGVFDTIDDNDSLSYFLRLEVKKDNEYIYLGKITEQMQFILGQDLNIYISNFNISSNDDGEMLFSISGMIAESVAS